MARLWRCGIGVVDDALPLLPLAKQVSLVVAAFQCSFSRSVPNFGLPSALRLVHAFSLPDNMDGLHRESASSRLRPWGSCSREFGPGAVWLLAALAGALIGFLVWNHPSRLFIGDCGSFFIGGAVAATSLVVMLEKARINAWTAVLFLLAIPRARDPPHGSVCRTDLCRPAGDDSRESGGHVR